MRIAFAQHSLELCTWPSHSDLDTHLEGCRAGHVDFGDDSEAPVAFHSATFRLSPTGEEFGIGICTYTAALHPYLLVLPELGRIFVGYNMHVVAIDAVGRAFGPIMNLESLFYFFWHLPSQSVVLVFHEIGVLALGVDGKERWRFSRDIIVDHALDDPRGRLRLSFLDSPAVEIDILTGLAADECRTSGCG